MKALRVKSGIFAAAVTVSLLGAQVAAAQDASSRLSDLKLSGDQPIQIESDKLEVNEANSMATFLGNVNVVQGQTLLKAGKMIVYYKNDGSNTGSAATAGSASIDRLEVTGKVYVKSGTQVATGDSGNFDMDTNVLTLSGKEVVLSDGPNVLRGCKLTVRMNSGQANVDSCGKRVQMLLTPGSQK